MHTVKYPLANDLEASSKQGERILRAFRKYVPNYDHVGQVFGQTEGPDTTRRLRAVKSSGTPRKATPVELTIIRLTLCVEEPDNVNPRWFSKTGRLGQPSPEQARGMLGAMGVTLV